MKGEGRGNKKCLAYVVAFIVFQAIVIAVFAVTVMKIRSPKVRFGTVTADNLSSGSGNAAASFGMDLKTQFAVKNTNFGHFKYDNATVTILYRGVPVGQAVIVKGRARARSTRRFDVTIPISSAGITDGNLGNDINSGILPLMSTAKLSGKVHLMKIIKKKKSGDMSCTMFVNLATRAVQDLKCK